MSTKALREAMRVLERGMPTEQSLAQRMKPELEAIERAAVDFTESDAMDEVAIDTVSTLERIARDVALRAIAKDAPDAP